MLIRSLVVASLTGLASLAATIAFAEEAAAPGLKVSFEDPGIVAPRLDFSDAPASRFPRFAPDPRFQEAPDGERSYEIALSARRAVPGLPVDVAVAQRASFGTDSAGDIARHGRGSELRLGQGLGLRRRETSWSRPAIYAFVAADDEALTWQPGARRTAFGGVANAFAMQDRVEIGDVQVGVTYEAAGLQASLAYVEREVSVRTMGTRTVTQDESFAGLTLTMRR